MFLFLFLFHPEILLDERSRLKGSLFFVLHVSISFHLEIRLRSGRHFGEPCALLYTFPFKQILFVQQCPNAWGRFFERSLFLVLHVSHFCSFRHPLRAGSPFEVNLFVFDMIGRASRAKQFRRVQFSIVLHM